MRLLFPDLSPENLRRTGRLETELAQASTMDVLRVYAAAAHELQHRRPDYTADQLARDVVETIDELHRAGLA